MELSPIERIALIRTRHVIRPIGAGGRVVCERDAVRVHPVKNGWRHDTAEVVAVNKAAEAVGEPRDLLR